MFLCGSIPVQSTRTCEKAAGAIAVMHRGSARGSMTQAAHITDSDRAFFHMPRYRLPWLQLHNLLVSHRACAHSLVQPKYHAKPNKPLCFLCPNVWSCNHHTVGTGSVSCPVRMASDSGAPANQHIHIRGDPSGMRAVLQLTCNAT